MEMEIEVKIDSKKVDETRTEAHFGAVGCSHLQGRSLHGRYVDKAGLFGLHGVEQRPGRFHSERPNPA